MRKFKLLKDLPDIKAGSIVEGSTFTGINLCGYSITERVLNNPEWFEEIKEPKEIEGYVSDNYKYFVTTSEMNGPAVKYLLQGYKKAKLIIYD